MIEISIKKRDAKCIPILPNNTNIEKATTFIFINE